MRILAIQNIGCEPLGTLEDILASGGARIEYRHPYRGEPLPSRLDRWEAAILLGGPMAVHENRPPFIADEVGLAAAAIHDDMPLLGICLGSQIIAAAAGARVYAGTEREVGWSEVRLTKAAASDPVFSALPRQLPVFQLHGDSFDLPEGAVHLASSPVYDNQAFRLGTSAYGLQFHVEVNRELARTWTHEYGDYAAAAGVSRESLLAGLDSRCRALLPAVDAVGRWLLDRCKRN